MVPVRITQWPIIRPLASRIYRNDDALLKEWNENYINMVPSDELNPLEELIVAEAKEKEEVLYSEIERLLAPQFWRIIKARYIEGRTIKDIAVAEDSSERTIQRYITKSRELIQRYFAQ